MSLPSSFRRRSLPPEGEGQDGGARIPSTAVAKHRGARLSGVQQHRTRNHERLREPTAPRSSAAGPRHNGGPQSDVGKEHRACRYRRAPEEGPFPRRGKDRMGAPASRAPQSQGTEGLGSAAFSNAGRAIMTDRARRLRRETTTPRDDCVRTGPMEVFEATRPRVSISPTACSRVLHRGLRLSRTTAHH